MSVQMLDQHLLASHMYQMTHCHLQDILQIKLRMILECSKLQLSNDLSSFHPKLTRDTWSTIDSLGIARKRRTHRGRRSRQRCEQMRARISKEISKTTTTNSVQAQSPVNERSSTCRQTDHYDKESKQQNLSFCMINARSLRNKTSFFADFVMDNNFDIVGICESWLHPDDDAIIADLNPGGYSFKHVPRPSRRGGGIAILYRSELHVKVSTTPRDVNSFELMEIDIIQNSSAIHLIVLYIPPSTDSPFTEFIEEFSSVLDYFLFEPRTLVISGDFNIHMDSASPNANAFADTLSAYDLVQHINKPTHVHDHTLDLLISRPADGDGVSNIGIMEGLSDHSAITCELKVHKPKLSKKLICSRKVQSVNPDAFMERLSELSFVENAQ